MNKVVITGRITRDLELKQTSTGKDIVNYSIAVPVDANNTDFINCTTFGESAKFLSNYCNKGDLIGVEGAIKTSQYVDSENKKHSNTYVLTSRVELFAKSTKKEETEQVEKSIEKNEVVVDESDLPF